MEKIYTKEEFYRDHQKTGRHPALTFFYQKIDGQELTLEEFIKLFRQVPSNSKRPIHSRGVHVAKKEYAFLVRQGRIKSPAKAGK